MFAINYIDNKPKLDNAICCMNIIKAIIEYFLKLKNNTDIKELSSIHTLIDNICKIYINSELSIQAKLLINILQNKISRNNIIYIQKYAKFFKELKFIINKLKNRLYTMKQCFNLLSYNKLNQDISFEWTQLLEYLCKNKLDHNNIIINNLLTFLSILLHNMQQILIKSEPIYQKLLHQTKKPLLIPLAHNSYIYYNGCWVPYTNGTQNIIHTSTQVTFGWITVYEDINSLSNYSAGYPLTEEQFRLLSDDERKNIEEQFQCNFTFIQ